MALHSFYNLTRIDLGFRTGNILTGRLRPPKNIQISSEQANSNARQLLAKLAALPGVRNSALSTTQPFPERDDTSPFSIAGHPVADSDRPVANLAVATPSYFDTFGAHLLQGRFLNDNDRLGSPQVLMVNQSFVDRFLVGENVLDQRLLLPTYGHRPTGDRRPSGRLSASIMTFPMANI